MNVEIIRCEVCKEAQARISLRDIKEVKWCEHCHQVVKEPQHHFCSYECLLKWMNERGERR